MPVNLASLGSVVRRVLYRGQPGTTATTLVTAPSATSMRVTRIVACNTTGAAAVWSLSSVASAGSPGAANRLLADLELAAKETFDWECGLDLDVGEFLSAQQGTAGAITVSIFGEVYS